jgi:hypothetical protein
MVMVLPRKFHRIWNKRYWVHQNPKLQWPHCIYVLIRIRYAFINARFFLFTNAKGTIENQDTANMASAGRGPNCKAIRNYYQSTSSFAKSRFVNALQISEDLNQALLGYYRDSLIRIGYAFRRVFFTNAKDTIANQAPGDQIQHGRHGSLFGSSRFKNVSPKEIFLWELTIWHCDMIDCDLI